MRRSVVVLVWSVVLLATVFWSPVAAQDDDAEATIAALETRVAELEAQLEPTPSPEIVGTPTLEEEPIRLNNSFSLLYYYFSTADDEINAYGEIVNTGDGAAVAPEIVFTFLDDARNVLGEDTGRPLHGWVEAGATMPFDSYPLLSGALLPGDWAAVEVSGGDDVFLGNALDNSMLSVEDIPATGPIDSLDSENRGKVVNNGEGPVSGVAVMTAHYDEDGYFVGSCNDDFLDITIQPGRFGRFTIYDGDCVNRTEAKVGRGSDGPYTYRIILGRQE